MAGDDGRSQERQIIQECREELHRARAAVRDEQASRGPVSEQSRERLVSALLILRDALAEHRDDPALDPEWSQRGVDWLKRFAGETVRVSESAGGCLSGRMTREVPAFRSVGIGDLLDTAQRLEEICRDLGFAAETTDATEHTNVSLGDLLALARIRGQDPQIEAIEGAIDDQLSEDSDGIDTADPEPAD